MSSVNVLKLFIAGVIVSFLFCYLEWGNDKSGFLFQIQYQIIRDNLWRSLLHPLVILPFLGQVILLMTLLQNNPIKLLVRIGILFESSLALIILIVGLLTLKYRIILSTLPFLFFAVITFIRSLGKRS